MTPRAGRPRAAQPGRQGSGDPPGAARPHPTSSSSARWSGSEDGSASAPRPPCRGPAGRNARRRSHSSPARSWRFSCSSTLLIYTTRLEDPPEPPWMPSPGWRTNAAHRQRQPKSVSEQIRGFAGGRRQGCSNCFRILPDIASAALYEAVRGGCCARQSTPRSSPSFFFGTSQRWKWGARSINARK